MEKRRGICARGGVLIPPPWAPDWVLNGNAEVLGALGGLRREGGKGGGKGGREGGEGRGDLIDGWMD